MDKQKRILQQRVKSIIKPSIPKRAQHKSITPYKPNEPRQASIVRFKPIRVGQVVNPSKPIIKTKPISINQPVTRVSRPKKLADHKHSAIRRNRNPHNDEAIKRLHNSGAGRILVILACGPSILEAPIERLKNHNKIDIMCINKPEPRVWPSTFWAFCDQSQYARNKEQWEKYSGLIINSVSVRARRSNQILISNISGKGFSRDLINGYYIGRSSTYAALQVAFWLGYKLIYILGLDMCAVGGKLHGYGVNPDVAPTARESRFPKEAESYQHATTILTEEERRKVFICSTYNPWPFVKSFNSLDQKMCVSAILDQVSLL